MIIMKKMFLIGIAFLLIFGFVSAEVFDITIKGSIVENGEKQTVYNVGLEKHGANFEYIGTEYVEVNSKDGFEANFKFDTNYIYSISINHEGYCLGNSYGIGYNLTRENGKFVITNFLDSTDKTTYTGTNFDMGEINPNHLGKIRVNTDIPVDLEILNSSGNSNGGNTLFKYQQDLSEALERGKKYKIVLTTETGQKWEKEFTSSTNYCETNLLTKKGDTITFSTCITDCPETEGGKVDYKFYKGWNLVSIPLISAMNGSSNTCPSQWKALFVYNPTYKGYIGGIGQQPNIKYSPNQETYNQYLNASDPKWKQNSYTDTVQLSVAWLYFETECNGKIDTTYLTTAYQAQTQELMNKKENTSKLLKGWNFISVAPWMEGSNFKTIFEDCEIEKANYFNNVTQQWGQTSSTSFASQFANDTSPLYTLTGKGYVVKVANDCYIKYNNSNNLTPPELPN